MSELLVETVLKKNTLTCRVSQKKITLPVVLLARKEEGAFFWDGPLIVFWAINWLFLTIRASTSKIHTNQNKKDLKTCSHDCPWQYSLPTRSANCFVCFLAFWLTVLHKRNLFISRWRGVCAAARLMVAELLVIGPWPGPSPFVLRSRGVSGL